MTHAFRCLVLIVMVMTASGAMAAPAEPIDLSKALKIGSGNTPIIEFTDPDCPYCRKAYQYFLTRKDVTLYIFFNPLSSHQHARDKALYILSSDDPEQAYAAVMSGVYDIVVPPAGNDVGRRRLAEQGDVARSAGINEVPVFMVFGRIVRGFDQKTMSALLPR